MGNDSPPRDAMRLFPDALTKLQQKTIFVKWVRKKLQKYYFEITKVKKSF